MLIKCFWEHNWNDTLLYAIDFLGAYARGRSLDEAVAKMPSELRSFIKWRDRRASDDFTIEVAEEKVSDLNVSDADSDAVFDCETKPMTADEYSFLKATALKSARDFLTLYNAVPDKNASSLAERKTFYGAVPITAEQMYEHTKNVNNYYFGEIGAVCDNAGDISSCRERGFELIERRADYLENKSTVGSYDEIWSLKKVLRRFIWHDRIHAKAMYRMAIKTFGEDSVPDVFCFDGEV